jgi:DNA-binding response OmpR family regulator
MKENQVLPAGDSSSTPLPAQPNPPCHILMVDDDPLIRKLNVAVLSHAGYEVDEAVDGADAWEALSACDYDLLITDNSMPKVTGVELLKKLRAARMSMPVIMATGILPTEEFTRYPWLQPSATLTKPYTIEELMATVQEVLCAPGGTSEQAVTPPTSRNPAPVDHLRQ